MRRFARSPLVLRHCLPAWLLIAVACGGGGEGGTTAPPVTPPGFSVTLSAATLTVEQGSAGTISASVTRTGSFSGTVEVVAEGLPAGVTATLAPSTIGSGTTSGTLSVSVALTVAPGNYPFTVRARATGLADQTFSASLTVTAKPAIALALTPATDRIPHTGSASFRAVISRVNYTGAVTLAVTGVPSEVTTTITQSADTFTVLVAVGLNAFEGTTALTVTATGTGVSAVSAPYTLVVVPRPASITLSISGNATRTTSAGGPSVAANVIISRIEYLDSVRVAVDGALPAGVSATFAPSPTPGNLVIVTFSTTAQAVPGTYPITLKGSGTGVADARVQVTLVVTPFASLSSITLSRPTVVVAQAGTASTTASIVRSFFTGGVTFEVTGVPAGVTVTLGNNPTGQSSMAITLTVAANATPGTSVATVTASGVGIAPVSTPLTITITLGGQPGNTTFQFCGAAHELPIWVGAQPGSRWQQLLPTAPNTYSVDFGHSGGFAWLTQDTPTQTTLHVLFGTQAELAAEGAQHCLSPSGRSATGSVSGLTGADRGSVSFGSRSVATLTAAAPGFTLTGLPNGARDLVALRTPGAALVPDRILVQRGVNPANGGSFGTLALGGAAAVVPATVTVQGTGPGEQSFASALYQTAAGTLASLGASLPSNTATHTVGSVPTSELVAGDVHGFAAFAGTFSGNVMTDGRSALAWTSANTAPALTLGPVMNTPAVSTFSLQNGIIRPQSRIDRQAAYDKLWVTHYSQASGGVIRNVVMTLSGGYQEILDLPQVTIRAPDLATAAGWQSAWSLQNNILISWTMQAFGWTGDGTMTEPRLAGITILSGFASGSYTPP